MVLRFTFSGLSLENYNLKMGYNWSPWTKFYLLTSNMFWFYNLRCWTQENLLLSNKMTLTTISNASNNMMLQSHPEAKSYLIFWVISISRVLTSPKRWRVTLFSQSPLISQLCLPFFKNCSTIFWETRIILENSFGLQ